MKVAGNSGVRIVRAARPRRPQLSAGVSRGARPAPALCLGAYRGRPQSRSDAGLRAGGSTRHDIRSRAECGEARAHAFRRGGAADCGRRRACSRPIGRCRAAPRATSRPGRARRAPIALRSAPARRPRSPCGSAMRWRSSCAGRQRPRRATALRTEAGRESLLRVTLLAEKPTTWTVAVAPGRDGAAFRYSIALTPPHAMAQGDRDRAAGVVQLAQAEALRAKGDKAVAEDARKHYRDAIEAGQRAGDACAARARLRRVVRFRARDRRRRRAEDRRAGGARCDLRGRRRRSRHSPLRLLGSAYINQGDFAAGTRETERAVAAFGRPATSISRAWRCAIWALPTPNRAKSRRRSRRRNRRCMRPNTTGDGKLLALVRNDLAFMHNARGEFALAADAYQKTLDTLARESVPDGRSRRVDQPRHRLRPARRRRAGDGGVRERREGRGGDRLLVVPCRDRRRSRRRSARRRQACASGGVVQARARNRRAHALVRQRAEALRGLGRSAMAAQDWDARAHAVRRSARRTAPHARRRQRIGRRIRCSAIWRTD